MFTWAWTSTNSIKESLFLMIECFFQPKAYNIMKASSSDFSLLYTYCYLLINSFLVGLDCSYLVRSCCDRLTGTKPGLRSYIIHVWCYISGLWVVVFYFLDLYLVVPILLNVLQQNSSSFTKMSKRICLFLKMLWFPLWKLETLLSMTHQYYFISDALENLKPVHNLLNPTQIKSGQCCQLRFWF